MLGSKELLSFEVLIPNYGEDAFEASFYMTIPPGMNFRKIEKIGDIRDTLITCTAPSPATNHTLKCDIGNPLASGKVVSVFFGFALVNTFFYYLFQSAG